MAKTCINPGCDTSNDYVIRHDYCKPCLAALTTTTENNQNTATIYDIAFAFCMGDEKLALENLKEESQITIKEFVDTCIDQKWLTDAQMRRLFGINVPTEGYHSMRLDY